MVRWYADQLQNYPEPYHKVKDIVQKNEESLCSDVLADGVTYDEVSGFTKEWSINGEKVTLGVEKK